jgi:hypothetical protein
MTSALAGCVGPGLEPPQRNLGAPSLPSVPTASISAGTSGANDQPNSGAIVPVKGGAGSGSAEAAGAAARGDAGKEIDAGTDDAGL